MGAEELAEKLKSKPTGPKYVAVAPPINRAMRRRVQKQRRLQEKHFETWKRMLNAVGINWEDVLVERKRKAEERKKAT